MDQLFEATGRIPGCQSTNHTVCWGELWACAACHKVICCQEGSEHDPDLCDDCWAIKHCSTSEDELSYALTDQSDVYLSAFVGEMVQEFGQAGILVVSVWQEKKQRAWWWSTIRKLLWLKGDPSHA